MDKNNPVYKGMVGGLADQICANPDIAAHCKRVANKQAGTTYWTEQEWEERENSAQYDLYWAVYSAVMVSIVLDAAKQLQGNYDG